MTTKGQNNQKNKVRDKVSLSSRNGTYDCSSDKEQQLTDEIELLYQEGLDNSYGNIIDDIEYKSNPLQIEALESLQKMGELKSELKGRQEARKETLIEVEKEYDKIITEDFSPEQLLAITHFYTRIKQQLQELGDK